MQGTLTLADGTITEATPDAVEKAVVDEGFFWLNLDELDEQASDILLHTFNFHALAVEDAEHFGQRPKIEEYDNFTYFVAHGVGPDGGTVEVHVFYTPDRIVTVHRGCHQLFDEVDKRLRRHTPSAVSPPAVSVLYLVIDELVDSFFPVLSDLDDQIDELEDSILAKPTDQQLGQLFTMKRQLVGYRKIVTPQRDMFARLLAGVNTLPGATDEDLRYFRDLYDHLIRISDLIDSYRDLVSGAVDTHLSTVSNRLNVVMKQLAIIATIFLPLSFLTGFFGQNFDLLVNHVINRSWAFWIFGIGVEIAAVGGLLVLFRRRGWIGTGD
jgi:magnesium transporter